MLESEAQFSSLCRMDLLVRPPNVSAQRLASRELNGFLSADLVLDRLKSGLGAYFANPGQNAAM